MPYDIHLAQAYIKDAAGNFHNIDAITDYAMKTTDDYKKYI